MHVESIRTDRIVPNHMARSRDRKDVESLAASMNTLGLLNPITVVRQEVILNGGPQEGFYILAGSHRLDAANMLGWLHIDAVVLDYALDDVKHHRLVEIAENLHRADLSAVDRAKMTKEWVELTGEQSAQVAPKGPVGHRPKSGVNDAARQLGIERTEVQRSMKIASLSDDAVQVARDNGLADNKSALLRAAQAAPERQADVLRDIAMTKTIVPLTEEQLEAKRRNALMNAWANATLEDRSWFLAELGIEE